MITLLKKKGVNPQTKEVIFYPKWTRKETVEEKELAKRMARGGTYSVGEAMGVMMDFPSYIMDELLAGNAVSVDGLGVFTLKVSGKSNADAEKVTTRGIRAEIVFTPASELEARLQSEAEYKMVTSPTEEGKQDVEEEDVPEPEPEPSAPNTGGDDGDDETLEG